MARSVKVVKDLAPEDFQELCRRLLEADPDIRDIVLIGSAAYAPACAHELDLVITTRKKKKFGVYMDAAADFALNVDVIPREVGERIGRLTWGIVTQGRALYGEGETIQEAIGYMEEVPTFAEARLLFQLADRNLSDAQQATDPLMKRHLYAAAFNGLFDIARLAVMAYLHSEQTRWGQLKRELPEPFRGQFEEIIDTLHRDYFYDRLYPRDAADEEYALWRDFVARFVDELEKAAEPS